MQYFRKTTKEQIIFFQICALISGFICVAIYIWSILDPIADNEYAFVIGNYVWIRYLVKIVYLVFFGLLCGLIWKRGGRKRRTFLWLVTIIGMVGYGILLHMLGYRVRGGMKELLLPLWPFFVYIAADRCIRFLLSRTRAIYLTGMALYYVALVGSIWIIEYKMAGTVFSRREPVEIIYLLVTGIIAWRIVKKHYRKSAAEWKTMASWIFPLSGFVAVFWNHERLLEILSGLTNPVSAVYADNPLNVNWIGYRVTLFWDAWAGDFSFIEDNWIAMNLYASPLFWIKYMKGWGTFLIVLVLELFLLYCIVSIVLRRNAGKNPFVKVLLTTVIVRSILGLLADLFVITTPDIGMLLLRNPTDILLILYLIFGEFEVRRECIDEGDRKGIKKN